MTFGDNRLRLMIDFGHSGLCFHWISFETFL